MRVQTLPAQQIQSIKRELRQRALGLALCSGFGSRKNGQSLLRYSKLTDYRRQGLLNYAVLREMAKRGDLDADEVLRVEAIQALKKALAKPALAIAPELCEYAIECLDRRRPASRRRGRDARRQLDRNARLFDLVRWLTDKYDLSPTRSEASRQKETTVSASSLVTEVLQEFRINISERAVEQAWKQLDRQRRVYVKDLSAADLSSPFSD